VQGGVLCTAWLNEPVGDVRPNPCRRESFPEVRFCAAALQLHSQNELLGLNLRLPIHAKTNAKKLLGITYCR
jgi:hypothetical protein